MRIKRVISVIATVFAVIAVLAALLLTVTAMCMRDGTARIFGYELRLVQTGSMEPSVRAGDIVFIRTAKDAHEFAATLSEGDIITFLYAETVVTHRIVGINRDGERYVFTARGDAAEEGETQTVGEDAVIGKVTYTARVLGYIVRALRKPSVTVFCIIVPSAIIILIEIARIVSVCRRRK